MHNDEENNKVQNKDHYNEDHKKDVIECEILNLFRDCLK